METKQAYKVIQVKQEIHQKAKIEAAKRGMPLRDFVQDAVLAAIKSKKQA
ncbi:MAG: hypothetical protein AAGG68_14870 [Bacteroidota bacterium]